MSESEWDGLLEQSTQEIRAALLDGVVRIPGACWLITARA